jgi:hypothetical protein
MEAATTATEGRAAAVQPILEVKNIEVVFNASSSCCAG